MDKHAHSLLSQAEVQTVICMLAGSAVANGLMSHVELTIAFVRGNVCSIVGVMLHLACGQHALPFLSSSWRHDCHVTWQ